MSTYTPKPQSKLPRLTSRNRWLRDARNIARKNREALENGGPERLDAAALRAALAEKRKAAKTTANEDKE